jgi:hypothetical protein
MFYEFCSLLYCDFLDYIRKLYLRDGNPLSLTNHCSSNSIALRLPSAELFPSKSIISYLELYNLIESYLMIIRSGATY